MLMPRKRFRFDNKYLYGSAAFVVGFGGIMTLFVNFAPVHVPNANIAATPDVSKSKEATTETTDTSQSDSQGQTNTPAPRSGTPLTFNPTPKTGGDMTLPTSPTAPVAPVTPPVTTEDETPILTTPIIPIPVITEPPLVTPDPDETPAEPLIEL